MQVPARPICFFLGGLVDLSRGKQFQRTVLLKKLLQSRIVVGPIAQETFEMLRERVQELNHGLVVVPIGRSKQEAHDYSGEADNGVQLEPEILHCLAAAHPIVSKAYKVAALLPRLYPTQGTGASQ